MCMNVSLWNANPESVVTNVALLECSLCSGFQQTKVVLMHCSDDDGVDGDDGR